MEHKQSMLDAMLPPCDLLSDTTESRAFVVDANSLVEACDHEAMESTLHTTLSTFTLPNFDKSAPNVQVQMMPDVLRDAPTFIAPDKSVCPFCHFVCFQREQSHP